MMDGLVESIEYYYDEDFSIPFDIGISEENNNSNMNQDYSDFRWMDIIDGEDNDKDDYGNDELEQVTVHEHIFSRMKSSQNCPHIKKSSEIKQSSNNDVTRDESHQSTARMSCSSSPNSGSSTANNVNEYNRPYLESFTHNMSFIESHYSLKSRVPLLNQSNKNILANYHLHFAPRDSFITSSIRFSDSKSSIKQDFINSRTTATDSRKCSAATADNIFIQNVSDDPMSLFQGFHSSINKQLKPEAVLWRQIKYLMLYYFAGWSLLKLFKQFRKKRHLKTVSCDDIVTCKIKNNTKRSKRYSCSVLEMYNSLNDAEQSLCEMINVPESTLVKNSIHNVSCQFPPKNRRKTSKEHGTPTKIYNQAYEYPGIGKVIMPKQTRLNASVFLSSHLESKLSFLQPSLSNQSDTTYNRREYIITGKNTNKDSPRSMCSLHCIVGCSNNINDNLSLKPCLRKDDEVTEPKEVTLRSKSHRLIAATDNFKRKSVSFDCARMSPESIIPEMKEIPKKWGLLGSEAKSSSDMLAIFECGRRDSLTGYCGLHDNDIINDDAARFREMVNDVLRAVKQISDRLSTTITVDKSHSTNSSGKIFHTQLSDLCELICTGDGLDTPLATAIDNLITLLSDGLVVTSFSSKKVRLSNNSHNKAAMRLWLLIEETCRLSLTNTNRKSELPQLLREVRHTMATCSSIKDHHGRLRSFIASALKSGLMHVWIRSVVANDTALQRFYCPEAFLRQARTGQSDALAAVTVSLKTLTIGNDQSTGLPPPVKISRRFLASPTSSAGNIVRLTHYCDETAESDSYAEESRSSQSECPTIINNNNNNNHSNHNSMFSRAATHPRFVKKSSTLSALNTNFLQSLKSGPTFRKPVPLTRPSPIVSIPMKTVVRSTVKGKPLKSDNVA